MTTELKIEGMSCGHCVKSATAALLGVDGIETAAVQLETASATVEHQGELDLSKIAAALDDEGFRLVQA